MNIELKFKPKKISLNTNGVVKAIQPYVEQALDVAEKKYLELMKQEVDFSVSSPHAWREEIKGNLKHIRKEIKGDIIKYYAGLDYAKKTYAWLRALVVAHGMGLGSDLNPHIIMAGPEGRSVTNKALNGRIPSKVKTERPIPFSWNHIGHDFIANATLSMMSIYIDTLNAELANIPASVFTSNIKIGG